ncbi:hypothetical protein KHQ89_07700 [Mycoplasmatota bacterium]|nr:hypothetical protein KHQ89_07700 [Mycoplasmatota bacterium]
MLLNIVLGAIIPIGFYKLYMGSNKKNFKQVNSGINWLIMYFKIVKVIVTIYVVFIGISALIKEFTVPLILILIIILAVFYVLFLYILAIFKEFFIELHTTFNRQYDSVPSVHKIKTYLVVILVLTIVIGSLFVMILGFELFNLGEFGNQLDTIQDSLNAALVTISISLSFSILSQVFLIYYANRFENTFGTFNYHYRKKIDEAYKIKNNSKQ